MRPGERVLRLLMAADCPLSGATISDITNVGSWRLYPILAMLERQTVITSKWDDDAAYPRRRMYKFAGRKDCDEQFRLASRIAADIGYVLVREPEHPDSPHAGGNCPYCGAEEPHWNGAYTHSEFHEAVREESRDYLQGFSAGTRSAIHASLMLRSKGPPDAKA